RDRKNRFLRNVRLDDICRTELHLHVLGAGNLVCQGLDDNVDGYRSGVRIKSAATRSRIAEQLGDLAEQARFLPAGGSEMTPQGSARVVHILPMAKFGGSRCTHAMQGVGELITGFMHVRQALEAFSE